MCKMEQVNICAPLIVSLGYLWKEKTIIGAFRREGTSKDSTLPVEECVYRFEVLSEFLKAGIPIGKIDMLRSLLEKNGYRLT